ncbi:MAG: serine hydrolase domain-containing protein [Gemmataceae bacterium]
MLGRTFLACCFLVLPNVAFGQAKLTDYYPPPEAKGGWRTLLPKGEPSAADKDKIKSVAGVDYDKLKEAWDHNAKAGGATGLLVIRRGHVVGEWYKDCEPKTPFNIYSSSKAYTSTAFGILLGDIEGGKVDKKLTLDTKVYTKEFLPEGLPLSDPQKADITLRHLLNMASGIGGEAMPTEMPFETALGKAPQSPFAKLKGKPGTVFNYSNAGVAHLVLIFNRVAGRDLFPYMKERVFDPIGLVDVRWQELGGSGGIGPFSQGYSGVHTNPREHARFCYLALHRGNWSGKQLVPASYYDFAWKGIDIKPEYGAQWWVQPRHPGAPKDLVQTAGARNNHGYVVPSLDLVFVRTGDGNKYPKGFEQDLVKKVIAAIDK